MGDAEVVEISDAQALIRLGYDAPDFQVGETVRLVPSHHDPTVNLHDWIVALRAGTVEEVWPMTARGASR